ncbi:MAG: hypothetical protein BWY22_01918 [Bacteroidetes bacterium ADurb.Bin217]|jgi:hypothetical protein|nr:MAG: hypothetical protein BWY22_01918 [Bacteroidetes bacterium ADurb.Bin217]
MKTQEALIKLLLPEGLLDYFEVTRVSEVNSEVWIYIEERNVVPKEYELDKLISKGFLPETCIQDFPLRGKKVFLYVKRRRWLNTRTNIVVTRDWKIAEQGTRLTPEFAFFFKELLRYNTGKFK